MGRQKTESTCRALALSSVAFALCTCDGDGSRSVEPVGAGGSTCHDYVTPDGYTCCCGQISCSRIPGCGRSSVTTTDGMDASTGGDVSGPVASGGPGVGGAVGTGGTAGAWNPGTAGIKPSVVVWGTGTDGGSAVGAAPATVDTENDPANCGMVGHRCQVTVLASGQTSPTAIVLDDASAYWIDASTQTQTGCTYFPSFPGQCLPEYRTNSDGEVVKVSLSGGDPVTLVSGRYEPIAIAVDATSVYWNEGPAGGSLLKVALSGGAVTTLVSGSVYPTAIAVDGTNVYFVQTTHTGEPVNLAKVSSSDGTVSTVAKLDDDVVSMAVDATSIYWATGHTSTSTAFIMKAPLAGGSPVTLAALDVYTNAIALDGTSVFFTFTADSGNGLAKVPLGGGTPVLLARHGSPEAVAADGARVYWSDVETPGSVTSAPIDGGSASTLASGQTSWNLAVHSSNICWTSPRDGLVSRVGMCRAGVCR